MTFNEQIKNIIVSEIKRLLDDWDPVVKGELIKNEIKQAIKDLIERAEPLYPEATTKAGYEFKAGIAEFKQNLLTELEK